MLEFGSISWAQILLDDWHSSSKVKYSSKEKDQGRKAGPVLAVRCPVIPSFSLLSGAKLRFRDLCRTWLFTGEVSSKSSVCHVKFSRFCTGWALLSPPKQWVGAGL